MANPNPRGELSPPEPKLEGLLSNQRFVRFASAKFLQLAAQNALIYGVFISIINRQESYIATSAFVLASVLPSVVLSLPGGLVADALPKKLVLLSVMAWRMAVVWLFFDLDTGVEGVIGLTFLAWTAYQFFSPAENAALPALVPQQQIASASSLLQALSLVAQLAGAGVVAPLVVDLLGSDALYLLVLLMMGAGGVLYALTPRLSPARNQRVSARRASWWGSLPQGYRTIRADEVLVRITVLRVLMDTGTLLVVVAAPKFIEDTLNADSAFAVYIASPAALGIALGLLLAPPLMSFLPGRTVVFGGFVMFTSVVATLPFIDPIARLIVDNVGFLEAIRDFTGLSEQVITVVFILPWAGFGMSLLQVAARAAVYRRVSSDVIAQVFATQSAAGSIAAVLPTFLAGALLDVLPVEIFLGLVAVSLIVLASAGTAGSRGIARRPADAAAVPKGES